MHRQLLLSIVCLLALSLFYSWGSRVSAQPDGNIKIGFVDLNKVFREYKQAKVMEEAIRRKQKEELAKIKGLEEQANQLKEEIPLYRKGSPIRQRKEEELANIAFDIKHLKDRANYFMAVELKSSMEQVYEKIVEAIDKYAKERSFFMVLKTEPADFFDSDNHKEVRRKIDSRNVLYWGDEYDITDPIIEMLNGG